MGEVEKETFKEWLDRIGIEALKNEIKDYEENGFIMGLFGICEMIASENHPCIGESYKNEVEEIG